MNQAEYDSAKAQMQVIRDERKTYANTATRIGEALLRLLQLQRQAEDSFLRKDADDTAQGIITFLRGLLVGNGSHGITADGAADLLSIVFDTVLKSRGARSGFTDGQGIILDANAGLVETDVLNVRSVMRVMELVFNQLQVMHRDYSFTEGAVVERVEPTGDGAYCLHIRDEQDGKPLPFTEGDIIYGIANNLLDRNVSQNGETPDYFHTWMRIEQNGVNQQNRTVTVRFYDGEDVPGGTNFTPSGLTVGSNEQQAEADSYDTVLAVTVHGNYLYDIVDGVKTARYPDRQNSWVLSATDKRLSFFWAVDKPIIEDHNYALCLGILPDLANLPATRDRSMPSLYVNTVFYDHHMEANYAVPPEYRVVDMGDWTQLLAGRQSLTADAWTDELGRIHIRKGTERTVTGARNGLVVYDDGTAAYLTWQVTYLGVKWLCVSDGATAAPSFGSADWQCVGGTPIVSLGFFTEDGVPLTTLPVRSEAALNETIIPKLVIGQQDASATAVRWKWERESAFQALDEAWNATARAARRILVLTGSEFPSGWENSRLSFKCTAWFGEGEDEAEITNVIQAF